jgi:hypothetical protein
VNGQQIKQYRSHGATRVIYNTMGWQESHPQFTVVPPAQGGSQGYRCQIMCGSRAVAALRWSLLGSSVRALLGAPRRIKQGLIGSVGPAPGVSSSKKQLPRPITQEPISCRLIWHCKFNNQLYYYYYYYLLISHQICSMIEWMAARLLSQV